jgi:hypothetical protein
MVFSGRITESAAATKTFGTLRIERRVLATPTRTIAIANIATVSVGTHVTPKPRALYWLAVVFFIVMAFGSMRPNLTFGPLLPNGATVVLGFLALVFAGLALRRDDKSHYLLISSSDGVLSRFTAPDRSVLDEVRGILTDKINRGDEAMTFSVNFEKGQIENLAASPGGGLLAAPHANGSGNAAFANGAAGQGERGSPPSGVPRSRPGAQQGAHPGGGHDASHAPARQPRGPAPAPNGLANGGGNGSPETFVDYSGVLPSIVEMHRFYARQPGTQHLEQRLSELELLMRAGTPTTSQKTRLRELSGEMSQILQAYPQAVELFDHVGGLVV